MTNAALGYNPRPDVSLYRGTPIPPVLRPLARSERRWQIAQRVWWNGPPWTILRNSSVYLYQVMDYGRTPDIRFTTADVPKALWHLALEEARPGMLSKGAYMLWSLVLERQPPGFHCDWPDDAHVRDIRPLAHESRERLYERFEHWHRAQSPY